MDIKYFMCIYLMSCFSSNRKLSRHEFSNCPDHCNCYSAPNGTYKLLVNIKYYFCSSYHFYLINLIKLY